MKIDDEKRKMVDSTFTPGEFFVYTNGSSWELGKVKKPADEEGTAYFCWYSSGTTAARTPIEHMHKLVNGKNGPAHQYTLVHIPFIDDEPLEVEDYFSQTIVWEGISRELPEYLSYYPVEDFGIDIDGGWARICR